MLLGMRRCFKYLFVISLLFCFGILNAQNKSIDSLNSLLPLAKNDTTKLNIYLQLCEANKPEQNLTYLQPALKLANNLITQNKNKLQGKILLSKKAKLYNYYSLYYLISITQKSIEKSIEYGENAQKLFGEANDKEGIKNSLRNLSESYGVQGNTIKQIECYKLALPISKELKDLDTEAAINFLLARIYFSQKDTSLTLSYFEESLKLFKRNNDDQKVTILLVQVGTLYEYKKNYAKANILINEGLKMLSKQKDSMVVGTSYNLFGQAYFDINEYDKAIENFLTAIKFGIKDTSFVGGQFTMLGKCYARKKEYNLSLNYYQKSLKIAENLKDDSKIAQSLIGTANALLMLNRANEANILAKRALILRENEGAIVGIMYAEKIVARSDSAIGNFKDAYQHFLNYIVLRDKLNGEDIRKEANKQKFKEAFDKEKEEVRVEQTKKDLILNR